MRTTALRSPFQGRPRLVQKQRSRATSVAAPIGGWNARDALGAMDKLDAVILENFWPSTTNVVVRFGHSNHATGLVTQVETLMAYSGGTSSSFKSITAGGNVFDVTSSGAVGAAELTGLSNGRFQYVNFATSAGNYLAMVNGVNTRRVWTGAAWFQDGDGAPYDITGVSSTTLVGLNNFKNRMWFVQNSTLKAWYLPVNALGGVANSLDMSSLCQLGGYLMAMGTWTIDGGYGVDDYAVWVTSEGEVLVWRMTDPTDPNSIFLIGIWRLGTPIGRRCFYKYGGDLLYVSQDGVVPLSAALQSSRTNPKTSITDKIQRAMSDAASLYSSNFGWQLVHFPKENQLYLNIPVSVGNQQQYVMNSITKNWCNFKGWSANCFEIFEDNLYYGANGLVCKAWDTNADAGQTINARALQAFSYFDTPTTSKRVTMIRPTLYTNGLSPSIGASVNYDYDLSDTTSPVSLSPTSFGTWDSGLWDSALWGGDVDIQRAWQGAKGNGYSVAPNLTAAANGVQIQWVATDMVYEAGGIL